MRNHRSSPMSSLCRFSAGAALLVALPGYPPASAATPSAPRDVVGISIGTDLMVDPGFGDAGYTVVNYNDAEGTWDEAVRVIAGDGGGSWLVGFHRTNTADADRLAISKIDANGVIDASYGVGGKLLAPTGVNLIRDAILVDDKFYIAGTHFVGSFGILGVACVALDGTPCAGFGDAGSVAIAVNADGFISEADRILYRSGKLYAIGNTDPGGGSGGHSSAIAIAKLDATTGALDATFGDGSGPLPGTEILDPNLHPDGNDFAYAAAFAANGNILVGGQAQGTDELGSEGYILSFDPASGALDTTFGTAGYTFFSFDTGVHFDDVAVKAIQVQQDGRIIAAGNANHDDEFFNTLTNVLLVSLQPDGTPSAGFGVDGVASINVGLATEVLDMVVRTSGELVVAMASNGILPNPYNGDMLQSIAQFDASGSGPTSTVSIEYPSMVTPGGRPTSLLVDANDRVLVAGFRLWDYNFPIPDSDHSLTRLMRDGIFGNGFEL